MRSKTFLHDCTFKGGITSFTKRTDARWRDDIFNGHLTQIAASRLTRSNWRHI